MTYACFLLHNFAHAEFLHLRENEREQVQEEAINALTDEFRLLAGALRPTTTVNDMVSSLSTITDNEQEALLAQQKAYEASGAGQNAESWRLSVAAMGFQLSQSRFSASSTAQNLQIAEALEEE